LTASPIAVPSSGTSPAMKPWMSETERMPSFPCSAFMRSTKERIGSRLVGNTSIMRQSKVEMTGLISPRAASLWPAGSRQTASVVRNGSTRTPAWACGLYT
jgi:hypothetical protein